MGAKQGNRGFLSLSELISGFPLHVGLERLPRVGVKCGKMGVWGLKIGIFVLLAADVKPFSVELTM